MQLAKVDGMERYMVGTESNASAGFQMRATELGSRIETLVHWKFEAKELVVFTGTVIDMDGGASLG